MQGNVVFNATVCLIGFVILMVHIVYLLIKKGRRRDENSLLVFFGFTAFHFAAYFIFTVLKAQFQIKNDAFIMGFYTGFYIANNLEIFFLFLYMMLYVDVPDKLGKPLQIINACLLSVFIVLDFVNVYTRMFFTSVDGEYQRGGAMIVSQIYQFILFAVVFLVTATNKKLSIREKMAFALYCFLPLVAIVFQNIFKGYAIAYLSIIVSIEILFFFLGIERNLKLAKEKEKNKDAQIRLMLSQIQPHFIYNSLSSISTLIPLDPDRAQQALDDFTEYLRCNLSTLTETRLIPFSEELRHIKTFVSLEEIRFQDRLKAVYDLQCTDFYVSPLSIQPLVENAVKHGILKKTEGGTVTLKTYDDGDAFVVEVLDDGVGFEQGNVDFASNKHFGLQNIEYRIAKMCGGTLTMESSLGKGTKAVVRFPKTGRVS